MRLDNPRIKGSSTGSNTIKSANASTNAYDNTLPAKSGTFAMMDDIADQTRFEIIVVNEAEFEAAYTLIIASAVVGVIRFGASFSLSKNHSFSHDVIYIEGNYYTLSMNMHTITVNSATCNYNNMFFDATGYSGSKFIFIAGYVSTNYIFNNCRFHGFLDSGSAEVFDTTAVTGSVHVILKESYFSGTGTINAYSFQMKVGSSSAYADITIFTYRATTSINQTKIFGYTGTKPSTLNIIYDGSVTLTNVVSPDNIYSIILIGTGTANEIPYWISASKLGTLPVATYPSLTELSYVKGVTSAIQTQLGLLAPKASPTFTGIVSSPAFSGRKNPRIQSITSSGSITPNADTDDYVDITALATPPTFNNPSGTPVNKQTLVIDIMPDATPRAITWSSTSGGYLAGGTALPGTTVASKMMSIILVYDSVAVKWKCRSVAQEA